jgi:hypothetical protein
MNAWVKRRIAAGLTVLVCTVILSACSTPQSTGVKTELTADALKRINAIGVQVTVPNDFSVVLQKDKMVNAGFLAGGVTGALIEHGINASADARTASKLRPFLGDLNCKKTLQNGLVERLKNTGLFKSVSDMPASPPVDGILTLNVKSWGLRTGMGHDSTQNAQPALEIHVLLSDTATSNQIWARDDYFIGGTIYKVEQFSESEGLLRKEVESVLNRYLDRLINEIRFAR